MVSPSQWKNDDTKELLLGLLECSSILGQYFDPYITKTIYSDICVEIWDLESLVIWYILSPNIYISIPKKHGNFFCHLQWHNFCIYFVQIKNTIFLRIIFFSVRYNHSNYISHPSYLLLQWLREFWNLFALDTKGVVSWDWNLVILVAAY